MVAVPIGIHFFIKHQISHIGITAVPPNPPVFPSVAAPTAGVTPAPSAVPSAPSASAPTAAPTAAPTTPAGPSMTISGIDDVRTIACNNSAIDISGQHETVTITGHCATVHVSGIKNVITVDATDAINVVGIDNQLTYHTGSPSIEQFGQGNVIKQG
jgi:hypothetical protein